jgi:MYXO-CTERM domain-containing protein
MTHTKKHALLAAICAAAFVAPTSLHAEVIAGSWGFTGTIAGNTYSGSFSFDGFDTSLDYTDSTAAGFSITTSFDTTGAGGNAFNYSAADRQLILGSLQFGVVTASGTSNDWLLVIEPFPDAPAGGVFGYYPATGPVVSFSGFTVTGQSAPVPAPTPLALLALGGVALAAAGRSRRRR